MGRSQCALKIWRYTVDISWSGERIGNEVGKFTKSSQLAGTKDDISDGIVLQDLISIFPIQLEWLSEKANYI